MKKKILRQRVQAVQRYHAGESPESICASLGKTKPWLYKWVSRYAAEDSTWYADQSRRPLSSPNRTPAEIERIVELVRLSLYNKGDFCGKQAIQWEMEDMNVQPHPESQGTDAPANRKILAERQEVSRASGGFS